MSDEKILETLSYVTPRRNLRSMNRHQAPLVTRIGEDDADLADTDEYPIEDDGGMPRRIAKKCEKLPFSADPLSRLSLCTEICCRGVCSIWRLFISSAGVVAFFISLCALVFLIYVHLRVEHELAAKPHSFRYALHMYAVDVRPPLMSGDGDAMAHGWIDFNERDLSVCYKLITTNFSRPLVSLSVHGPLWSMEPEYTDEVFLALAMPNDRDEDNLYAACMPDVGSHVFVAVKGDPAMYYVVAVNNNATWQEAARSYFYGMM